MSSQMKTLIGVVIVAIIAIGGYLFLKKPAEEAAPTAEAPAATTTEPAATTTAAAPATKGPQTVAGPSMLPECFKPYAADTKFFQWAKKDGPYRIALANGFVGNTWRIQMIKTAKAFVEAAGCQAGREGAEGRQHRHGRGGADRRHRQLHQLPATTPSSPSR